jgi:hypothetical protein
VKVASSSDAASMRLLIAMARPLERLPFANTLASASAN